ncbi:MAG: SCP2 sterol-binding domain-containing protein [Archaeoglobus sp.]|uniref:SCP2 sterol-binding domain-containing protein n=1 Tax=Archaeoglobus sp. TaxID=1872626 RepID=UPI001D2A0B66|nr:SCP2 sterol-binding domain-containing protein [Archaeoglobus sp.]MBO8180234.1 SCP2 sterol-binding domain-containing protein [Archaeoglobus sp.]
MKWGSAFKLAIKAFLFGLVWFVVGALLVVGGMFLFFTGIRILAFLAGFVGLFVMFFGLLAAVFKVGSNAFLEKYEASLQPVEVTYENQGFAMILGQLIDQAITKSPSKGNIVRDLKGNLVVEVTDMNAAATVEFNSGRITVYNGMPAKGKYSLISSDFETINSLATGKAGLLKTLKLIITGKLKIKGIKMARKFQSLLA